MVRVTDAVTMHGVFVTNFATVCHKFGSSFDAATFPPMLTWKATRCKLGKGVRFMEKRTEWGQTTVHDEVLQVICARAALTVSGVVKTSQHGLSDNLGGLVGHDAEGRGVRIIEMKDGHYAVEIHLTAAYGVRLGSLGKKVGIAVNQALKDAVGLYPDRIAIHFEGTRAIG